ncbi:MAG: serine--tRNA ligase [Patescibacteria group bacterium]
MLDIKYIRDNHAIVKDAIKNKKVNLDLDSLISVDERRRDLIQKSETVRSEQKKTQDRERGTALKAEFKLLETQLTELENEFAELMLKVPNIPTEDTPIGMGETENVISKTVGEPTKFKFKAKDHWELAQLHDLIDKERAAKIAGSRFAYLKGDLVKLQFAIIQFTMNLLTDQNVISEIIESNKLKISDKPFVAVLPPFLIRTDAYKASARLNGTEVTYKLDGDDLWLNASAEHSLCPMYMNETLDEAKLPIRYIGYSTAFRREAGTYGKDMEGILRMHQFDKLEMETFSVKEDGFQEHLLLVAAQEYMMQKLEIPYHVLLKCTAEIGTPNARGVDIEAWLPGQNAYRETHTADYMTDFQARRLQTKVKRSAGEVELVHTNDATAFAIGRIMIAIMENFQQEDGSIKIPKALHKYTGFAEIKNK